nr:MAG: hypothetical protein [Microvirus Sku28]
MKLKINNSQYLEIIKIVCTAIISIATTLLATSCTTVFTTSKKGGGQQTITISTEQRVDIDSTYFDFFGYPRR